MRQEWPIVAVIHNHPQAETLRLNLESEGIETILDREMNPNFTLIDSEFRLRVRPDRAAAARKKIADGPFARFVIEAPTHPDSSHHPAPPPTRDELLPWKLLVVTGVVTMLVWWFAW